MMSIQNPITVDIIGIAFIAVGAFGLIFINYKFNKPDDVKVFGATALLSLFFWNFILTVVGYRAIVSFINFPTIVLALCTGFRAAKLTKLYGAIGHTIPRFLIGFLLSCFVVHSFLEVRRFRPDIYIISGLLFTPISFLTPSFMLTFIVVFIFSSLISNGLMILNIFARCSYRASLYISVSITTILGLIRLYYFYKEELQESNIVSDSASDTERQPIASEENPSYSTVSNEV